MIKRFFALFFLRNKEKKGAMSSSQTLTHCLISSFQYLPYSSECNFTIFFLIIEKIQIIILIKTLVFEVCYL